MLVDSPPKVPLVDGQRRRSRSEHAKRSPHLTAISSSVGEPDFAARLWPRAGDLSLAALRRIRTSHEGTFGFLIFQGNHLVMGELPWHSNSTGVSCIPPGRYFCDPKETESRGVHFVVRNVPDRRRILIHAGHWCGDKALGHRSDVNGSLLVGQYALELAGQMAVMEARQSLNWLARAAPAGFMLDVSDGTPGRRAGGFREYEKHLPLDRSGSSLV